MKKKIVKSIFYILEDGTKGCEAICIELNIPKEIKKRRRVECIHNTLTAVGSEMAKTSIIIGLAVPSAIWLKGVSEMIPEKNKAARTAVTVGGSILFGAGNACLAEAVGSKLFTKEPLYENKYSTYESYIRHCVNRMVDTYYDKKFGEGKYVLIDKNLWEMLNEPQEIQDLFKFLKTIKEEPKDDDTGNT